MLVAPAKGVFQRGGMDVGDVLESGTVIGHVRQTVTNKRSRHHMAERSWSGSSRTATRSRPVSPSSGSTQKDPRYDAALASPRGRAPPTPASSASALTVLRGSSPTRRSASTSTRQDEWIRERSGIITRHFAAEDETVVDMAAAASEKALASAGVRADEIDTVIVSTVTHLSPDAVGVRRTCLPARHQDSCCVRHRRRMRRIQLRTCGGTRPHPRWQRQACAARRRREAV